MNVKNNKDTSRITININIPKKLYQKLKTHSDLHEISMQEIIVEAIKDYLKNTHIPNKATIKAIRDAENGKGLVRTENLEDLFKKLGI